MNRNNFDILRFYFASIVVISHLIGISRVEEFKNFAVYFNTDFSISGFFCISGYLITKSYVNSISLKSYFSKRAARILPAYLFVIILCSFSFSLISSFSLSEYFNSAQLYRYLGANLVFLNSIQASLPGVFIRDGYESAINGALWTLKVEIAFYLSVPLLLLLLKRINQKHIVLIGVYLFSVIYQYVFDWYFLHTGNTLFSSLSHQFPRFLSYFVSGMALFYYFDLFIANKQKLFVFGVLFLLIGKLTNIEILTPIALSCVIFAIAFSFKGLNSFAKYGDISFGIYIYHCPIINLFVYLGFYDKYNPYLVSIIFLLILFTFSFLSWHFLEKRFLSKVKSVRNLQ